MGYFQHFFILFVVLVLYFKSSNARIQCYECNSHDNSKCLGDEKTGKVDENLLITCPEKSNDGHTHILCRKIKQVIDFEVNNLKPETRVIRGCGWDNSSYANRCYHRSGFGGRQEVCACQQDGCNGSPALLTNTISIPFMILLILALFRLSV